MLHALLSGALLGLLSIPHCAAMCGPLAALACSRTTQRSSALRYQLGRMLGYGTAGALAGHLGRVMRLSLQGTSAVVFFSVLAAAACLLVARNLFRKRQAEQLVALGVAPRKRSLSARVASILPADPTALGALSSLLPCGVLAAALLVAMATSQAALGVAVMLGFATSSGVALLAASAIARLVTERASDGVRRGMAIALVVAAIALVGRPVSALVVSAYQGTPAKLSCH